MSFGDISKNVWASAAEVPPRPASKGDQILEISVALQTLQRDCQTTNDTITSMRRKKIGPTEKNELSVRIKSIKDAESQLKIQMDAEYQKIEAMPRPEAAAKRAALGKLIKDFEKVKVNIQTILNQSALVKVVNERGEVESFARTGSAVSSATNSLKGVSGSYGGPSGGSGGSTLSNGTINGGRENTATHSFVDVPPPAPVPMTRQQQQQHAQQMKLQPLLVGQEVDDAILEEREQAIKQMNHDLILVNEMFQDMAVLVDKQGGHIKEIAAAADNTHERTKAGLEQVNKAAEYQPGCIVC